MGESNGRAAHYYSSNRQLHTPNAISLINSPPLQGGLNAPLDPAAAFGGIGQGISAEAHLAQVPPKKGRKTVPPKKGRKTYDCTWPGCTHVALRLSAFHKVGEASHHLD